MCKERRTHVSSVSIGTKRNGPGPEFRQGQEIFVLSKNFRPTLRHTGLPFNGYQGFFFLGVQRQLSKVNTYLHFDILCTVHVNSM